MCVIGYRLGKGVENVSLVAVYTLHLFSTTANDYKWKAVEKYTSNFSISMRSTLEAVWEF